MSKHPIVHKHNCVSKKNQLFFFSKNDIYFLNNRFNNENEVKTKRYDLNKMRFCRKSNLNSQSLIKRVIHINQPTQDLKYCSNRIR